jgi:glycosyltransferase involved in cell wall biosynthesis
MRVTFVLPGIISLSGGSRVVFEYANRLADMGHEVCVVYSLLPPRVVHGPAMGEIREDIGALRGLFRGNPVTWFDLKAKLVRVPSLDIAERLMPDADAVVATAWETAYAVSRLSDSKGKKFYFIQHYEAWGLWDDEGCWAEAERIGRDDDICLAMADVVPKDARLKEYKEAVDRTYKLPLTKITISSWLKRLAEEKFGEHVEGPVINGINTDVFYPDPSVPAKKGLSILMPYRKYRNKGTEDGIKALGVVSEKRPGIEFTMYGEKRPDSLPEWISFAESPTDNELRRLYSDAGIFVCPSRVEGFGLTPMEASACGCAVVATNVGAVPDYAVDGRSILATPPRDPDALAAAIIRLIDNEDERRSIAERGNEYVKRFTWEKATDLLEGILKKHTGKV